MNKIDLRYFFFHLDSFLRKNPILYICPSNTICWRVIDMRTSDRERGDGMAEAIRNKFIEVIKNRTKVKVTFFSKEDASPITRVCAPMDYGPSRRARDKSDRFHLWDYEGKRGPHIISIIADKVTGLEIVEDSFDPAKFVTWAPNWFIERDWGEFS